MAKQSKKSVTEKLNKVYPISSGEEWETDEKSYSKPSKNYTKGKIVPDTEIGIDLGDSAGSVSASAVYWPCPHCEKLIDLGTYKGLFFDEYLNRMPKKDLKNLLAEHLDKKSMLSVGEKEGGLRPSVPPTFKEGQPKNEDGQPLFTLDEFMEKVRDMRFHQPIYKQLKATLKERDQWKNRAPGGAFRKVNPYRIKK